MVDGWNANWAVNSLLQDSLSQADPVSMRRLVKGLDEFLQRDQDRALFDLVPKGATE